MRKYLTLIPAALCVIISGCERAPDASHPNYFKAMQCRDAGDYTAAAEQLRKLLISRPDSAAGHLAAASIYDENLNDPVRAVYHYREYLRCSADRGEKEMVRAWLKSAEERYRSGAAHENAPENGGAEKIEALQEQITALTRQNQELKRMIYLQSRELSSLRQERREQKKVRTPETSVKTSGGYTEYTVQNGDTLGRIAKRFYGASSQYPLIMKANNLSGSSRLHIGQKLRIPLVNVGE